MCGHTCTSVDLADLRTYTCTVDKNKKNGAKEKTEDEPTVHYDYVTYKAKAERIP